MEELRKAHTGEHILFQSLSRVSPNLRLDRINLTAEMKSLIVISDKPLSWNQILEAQYLANQIISEGRIVKRFVGGKEELQERYGNRLRGNWDRIGGQRISVVEIPDFDCAACSGDHVENTREVEAVLVTSVNRIGRDRYEIKFEVGDEARRMAIRLSTLALKVSTVLGSPLGELEKTAFNLKRELAQLREEKKRYDKMEIERVRPQEFHGFKLFSNSSRVSVKLLAKRAEELVAEKGTIVVFASSKENSVSIVLARSRDVDVDAVHFLRRYCSRLGGNAGGSSALAIGGVTAIDGDEVIKGILELMADELKIVAA